MKWVEFAVLFVLACSVGRCVQVENERDTLGLCRSQLHSLEESRRLLLKRIEEVRCRTIGETLGGAQ